MSSVTLDWQSSDALPHGGEGFGVCVYCIESELNVRGAKRVFDVVKKLKRERGVSCEVYVYRGKVFAVGPYVVGRAPKRKRAIWPKRAVIVNAIKHNKDRLRWVFARVCLVFLNIYRHSFHTAVDNTAPASVVTDAIEGVPAAREADSAGVLKGDK